MATNGNVRYRNSWTIGIVFAIVIAVAAAAAVLLGCYYTMPEQLTVMIHERPFDVFITEEFYGLSRNMMLVSLIFPVAAYLWMYGGYARLAGMYPERKNEIKKGKLGNPWLLPGILLVVLLLVWGAICWTVVSKTLFLNLNSISDGVMFQRFIRAYAIGAGVDILLYVVGTLLFKPSLIQTA